MDPRKRKRVIPTISSRSIATRSKSGAGSLLLKTESKFNVAKRKADSPSKLLNEKSVFRDLTNREAPAESSFEKTQDDKVIAAAKKLANTNIGDHTTRKAKPHFKTTVNKAPPKQNEGVLTSYFRVTKTAKTGHLDSQKAKNLDPRIKRADSHAKIVSAVTAACDTKTKTSGVEKNLQIKKENVEQNSNEGSRSASSCASTDSPSLYVTALEELSSVTDDQNAPVSVDTPELDPTVPPKRDLPLGVSDFDAENWIDPFQVSNYATDIFNYFKSMEPKFQINDYMCYQRDLTTGMRAVVVDWMVELQETFELNHETLYLAVKLLDSYLSKVSVKRDMIQLVAVSSVFIAAKYDERFPPSVDDHVYVCEKAYTNNQLKAMEISILKTIDYNLGFPISYRFLRRFARFGRVTMPTLTLARYILEYSLMDYSFLSESDSKLAAAALLLALKMKDKNRWTPDLQYASGYTIEDLKETSLKLNIMLHRVSLADSKLASVKNKYSHKIFFEVAKMPLLKKLEFN